MHISIASVILATALLTTACASTNPGTPETGNWTADGKATPDLPAWKNALAELEAYEGDTVFGGRGETAPVAEAVDEQIAYLTAMEKLVKDYVTCLGPEVPITPLTPRMRPNTRQLFAASKS